MSRVALLAVPVFAAVVLTGGCAGSAQPAAEPTRAVGGPSFSPAAPPETPMDRMEQPVARRLAPRLASLDLTLQHVRCPQWRGELPASVRCHAYVDGVVADVLVRLEQGGDGTVAFDAELDGGLVATSELVDRLEDEGFVAVDCGDRAAYPARVGTEVVCRAHRGETEHTVVATVTDRRGAVEIAEHR